MYDVWRMIFRAVAEHTLCNRSLGVGICPLSYQCYELSKTCDGIVDCTDGYDEIACKYQVLCPEFILKWDSQFIWQPSYSLVSLGLLWKTYHCWLLFWLYRPVDRVDRPWPIRPKPKTATGIGVLSLVGGQRRIGGLSWSARVSILLFEVHRPVHLFGRCRLDLLLITDMQVRCRRTRDTERDRARPMRYSGTADWPTPGRCSGTHTTSSEGYM